MFFGDHPLSGSRHWSVNSWVQHLKLIDIRSITPSQYICLRHHFPYLLCFTASLLIFPHVPEIYLLTADDSTNTTADIPALQFILRQIMFYGFPGNLSSSIFYRDIFDGLSAKLSTQMKTYLTVFRHDKMRATWIIDSYFRSPRTERFAKLVIHWLGETSRPRLLSAL